LRAKEGSELNEAVDISILSAIFETFLFGLSTQARDGVSLEMLDLSITGMMASVVRLNRP
jgi:TetR/AcrR family transcriptional repressor for divergent bdcA